MEQRKVLVVGPAAEALELALQRRALDAELAGQGVMVVRYEDLGPRDPIGPLRLGRVNSGSTHPFSARQLRSSEKRRGGR